MKLPHHAFSISNAALEDLKSEYDGWNIFLAPLPTIDENQKKMVSIIR
jgi:hypothetical protein